MRINVAVPEAQVTKPVLDAALESVTRLNEQLLQNGSVPTFRRALNKQGIRWRPEPPGEEHFDHAGVVQRRNWGDCDDLAPWHAASLRATGEDPEATAVVRRSGPTRWHAYVERSDGSTDDPSREAGMGKRPEGVVGAVLPLMYSPVELQGVGGDADTVIVRPSIAARPTERGWQARVDVPWHERSRGLRIPSDLSLTTLAGDIDGAVAVVGALEGACKLAIAGGYAHPDHIRRMAAICDHIEGVPLDEIAACYGDEHAAAAEQFVVGSFFKKLKRGLKKGARFALKHAPMAGKLVQFIPGIGPVIREGIDLTTKLASRIPGAQKLAPFIGPGGFPVM
jgi:hypothetical protein